MIAPTFESLATKYAKPNKIAFVKVDVDAQGEVAQQYGVRSMPTFLVLRNGSVIDTISGANPPALIAAVEKAVKLAGAGGGGSTFSGAGNRLGGAGVGRGSASVARPAAWGRWDLKGFVEAVIAFIGLYLYSLISVGTCPYFEGLRIQGADLRQLDPYKAAEKSPFNKNNRPQTTHAGGGTRLGGAGGGRPAFKTMADLGSG